MLCLHIAPEGFGMRFFKQHVAVDNLLHPLHALVCRQLPRIAVLPDGIARKAREIVETGFRRNDRKNIAALEQSRRVAVRKPDDTQLLGIDRDAPRGVRETALRHHRDFVAGVKLHRCLTAVADPACAQVLALIAENVKQVEIDGIFRLLDRRLHGAERGVACQKRFAF